MTDSLQRSKGQTPEHRPNSRKHPRRAISVKAETIARLRIYAKSHGGTCSGLVEKWIAETLPSEAEEEPL